MRHLNLFALLKFFGKHAIRHTASANFRLSIVSDKPAMSTLRRQVFTELNALGLVVSQATVATVADPDCACLTVKLHCPAKLRPAFSDMAFRLLQQPQVRRVHWGQHKMSAKHVRPVDLQPLRA